MLGTIGYSGSIVFYNSFLPVIAAPEDQDRISARGYAMGYLGGVILLLFNLTMLLKPGWFGIPQESSLPARIAFITVFLLVDRFFDHNFHPLTKIYFTEKDRKRIAFFQTVIVSFKRSFVRLTNPTSSVYICWVSFS